MTQMQGTNDTGFRLIGRHVLLSFIVFFGMILASNVAMIYLALSTFPGLENNASYKAGRDYNRQIEAARAQGQLGWSGQFEIQQTEQGVPKIVVTYQGREDWPVGGLEVSGTLNRTVHSDSDVVLLFEEVGPGTYAATPDIDNLMGQWQLQVTAENAQGEVYRLDQRIYLKP